MVRDSFILLVKVFESSSLIISLPTSLPVILEATSLFRSFSVMKYFPRFPPLIIIHYYFRREKESLKDKSQSQPVYVDFRFLSPPKYDDSSLQSESSIFRLIFFHILSRNVEIYLPIYFQYLVQSFIPNIFIFVKLQG